jgi:hypothetical protein
MSDLPQHIDHPSAWKGSDFAGPDDVAFRFEERHLDAMRAVVARAKAAGVGLQELTREHTSMAAIEKDLADIRHELMDGRGVIILQGWPIEEMSPEELGIAYWAMGTYFGKGVSQSPMGDRLGYVTDVSKPGQRERGYRSAQELSLHTDSDDIVGLLCVRQGRSGGMSRLASSVAIYNEIAATRPDLIPVLAEGFHYHWFGEQPPGEGIVTSYKVPVFGFAEGKLSCCYLREFIRMAADEPTATPLTDREEEAIALFEEIADRDDIVFTYRLEPGWSSLINNYTTLHSRTGFTDWPESERKRLLLRLWLKAQPPRPVHANLRRYYGEDGMFIDGRTETVFDPNRVAAE